MMLNDDGSVESHGEAPSAYNMAIMSNLMKMLEQKAQEKNEDAKADETMEVNKGKKEDKGQTHNLDGVLGTSSGSAAVPCEADDGAEIKSEEKEEKKSGSSKIKKATSKKKKTTGTPRKWEDQLRA